MAKQRAGSTAAPRSKSRPSGASRKRRAGTAEKRPGDHPRPEDHETGAESLIDQQIGQLVDGIASITGSALRFASRTRESANRAISRSPEQLRQMAAAGESLRDLRDVLGMTASEIVEALNLKDRSILQAIEEGREVMSVELILRMASLYARNDPLPFILKYTRTYQPRLWAVLKELKLESLPLAFERERLFINIYRQDDAARQISDQGFERVLGFTRQAFDMALGYVAEAEGIERPVARGSTGKKQPRGKKEPTPRD